MRAMRVAIGGIEHETNTYADASSGPTTLEAFRVERGDEIGEHFGGTETFEGGMLAGLADLGATILPTLTAFAQPSGTIARAAYEALRDELCERLARVLPLDAVLLPLHGAGVAEGIDDLEGDLVEAVRRVAGPDAKLVATFDLHGNPTQAMADVLDAGFGCHLYPHTDMGERGREAVAMLSRLLDGLRPVTVVERLPMLVPPSTTLRGPAARVNQRCAEVEAQPGVLDCTFFHGFPYADGPHVGSHVWVTTDGDAPAARDHARSVARFIWDMRQDFRPDVLTPERAVQAALAIDGEPIVINETSDNAGGGAPADGTHLLRAMLDAKVERACFGYLCDPSVAGAAHAAGIGATIECDLGGKTDDLHGAPVRIRGTVRSLSDGRYRLSAWAPGLRMDHGPMARLEVDGIDIIVGSQRSQTFTPDLFLLNGIDPRRYKIVALKSSQHFRAGFEPIAAGIVTADGGGLTTLRPQVFPRARTPRPIWPLDPDARYP
jgi:microcystin degradation protein MlrC